MTPTKPTTQEPHNTTQEFVSLEKELVNAFILVRGWPYQWGTCGMQNTWLHWYHIRRYCYWCPLDIYARCHCNSHGYHLYTFGHLMDIFHTMTYQTIKFLYVILTYIVACHCYIYWIKENDKKWIPKVNIKWPDIHNTSIGQLSICPWPLVTLYDTEWSYEMGNTKHVSAIYTKYDI